MLCLDLATVSQARPTRQAPSWRSVKSPMLNTTSRTRTLKRSRSRNGGRWPIQTSRLGEPSQGVGVLSVVAGGARGGGGAGGAARRASNQAEARGPVPVAASSGSARSVPWVSSTARTLAVSGAPTTDDT